MKVISIVPHLLAFAFLALPAGADHPIGDKLGTIHFDVTGSDAARERVVRGVKLLHHMMYLEADREFAAAIAADPDCAMAYWGRAMALVHPLWPDVPTDEELKQGAAYVQTGLARGRKTPRETAYLHVMETYFKDAGQRGEPARLKALDEAWARVAGAHPDDLDAAAFSALFHLAPARFLPKDKSHRIQLTAGTILQRVLEKLPDHPGAQHYKIHAYDFPMLADRALEICDSYGTIAPDVPHALHMPTHIFTRRGLWEKSIEFNRRSAEAARKLGENAGTINGHYPHALDYLVYAHLQRGQYGEADTIRREVLAMTGPYLPSNRPTIAFAFAAIPARYALERQDWAAAARLQVRSPETFPWSDDFLYCDSIVHFARAIGSIRSGSLDTARRVIGEQDRLSRRISGLHPNSYWASQAETQLLAARGWLALSEGRHDQAVALMRRAAELEANTDKEAVTPGEVLPAGDLLGEMLLELGRSREALQAFESQLEVSPNRLNTLFGAARAAEQDGNREKATRHYNALLELAAQSDPGIQRVEQAKLFLLANSPKRAE
jgi:tetratricopeptide (TPR) repeat protein